MEAKIVLILGIVFLCVIVGFSFYLIFIVGPNRQKKYAQEEQEKRNQQKKKFKKKEKKWEMEEYLPGLFGIEMGNNLEDKNKAYDEIVRLVNLEAVRTAEACVEQDKINRGVGGEDIDRFYDYDVADLKADWAKMRNNALKLCPDLKDRLPHFSEFEPLKSYNAEHLLKKKQKTSN